MTGSGRYSFPRPGKQRTKPLPFLARLHWLVSFKRDGRYFFFADSRRPAHIAGPYTDIQTFVKEYEHYRGREIVSFQELDSYRKKQKASSGKEKKNHAEGDF